MRYALWLVPTRDSDYCTAHQSVNRSVSASNHVRPFPAHVTLCPSFVAGRNRAIDLASQVASVLRPIDVKPTGDVTVSSSFWRAAVIEVELTTEMLLASTAARAIIGHQIHDQEKGVQKFEPHSSMLYGSHSNPSLEKVKAEIKDSVCADQLKDGFVVNEIALVMCCGTDYHCWDEVERFSL